MKRSIAILMLGTAMLSSAWARNTPVMVPLDDVVNMSEAKGKLDGSVKFFMKGQATPAIKQRMSEDVSNHKTNGFNKDDMTGCKWAALSALIALQDKAKSMGADAVVDIVSFDKRHVSGDATSFECHAGAFVTGVTLKGTYVKLK